MEPKRTRCLHCTLLVKTRKLERHKEVCNYRPIRCDCGQEVPLCLKKEHEARGHTAFSPKELQNKQFELRRSAGSRQSIRTVSGGLPSLGKRR